MKQYLFVLSVFFALFGFHNAENCQIEGLTEGEWSKIETVLSPINDIDVDVIVGQYKTTGVIGLTVQSGDKYLSATLKNDVLTIQTTKDLLNYGKENTPSSKEAQVTIECILYCAGNTEKKKLIIHQPVLDVNNHAPTFNNDIYEYNFNEDSISQDIDLTDFGPILVNDKDFSNSKIYFTIEDNDNKANEYFNIENVGAKIEKTNHYNASLKVLKTITAPFKQEFVIRATDAGNPTLSSSAKVVVRVDPEGLFNHPPVFSKNIYYANYTNQYGLELAEEMVIRFGSTKALDIIQSGYKEYFEFKQDNIDKSKINIKQLKALPSEITKKHYIVIEIKAKSKQTHSPGRTALIINFNGFESTNIKPPIFGEHLYFGEYSEGGFKINGTITIQYDNTKKLAISTKGYEEFFEATLNSESPNTISVELKKPISGAALREHFLVVYIEATTEGVDIVGRTALLIYMKPTNKTPHPPVFYKNLYFATYKSHQLQMEDVIKIRSFATPNMIIRLKDHEEYFSVTQNPDVKEQIDVNVLKELTKDSFPEGFVVLQIEAENRGQPIPGRTAVIIRLQ